jgi:hypothetical protein
MRYNLVCKFAVVLQDVVLLQLLGGSDTFAVLEDFDEVVIGCVVVRNVSQSRCLVSSVAS